MGQSMQEIQRINGFDEDSIGGQDDLASKNIELNRKKFPKGFDGLDILILQRSIESMRNDDLTNPRNRRTKRYIPNEMGMIKDTEVEAISNYINDFMTPYIRKDKIEVCMKNIPGFDPRRVKIGGSKHFS
jgi:hypothetical protein